MSNIASDKIRQGLEDGILAYSNTKSLTKTIISWIDDIALKFEMCEDKRIKAYVKFLIEGINKEDKDKVYAKLELA